MRATWYNENRVRQPGSVVLGQWLASRQGGAQRAGVMAADARHVLSDREAMADIFSLPGPAARAVTPSTAMQVSAFYACITLIAGAIASLPLAFFERTDDGGRRRIKHDYWWLFNEQPSPLIPAAVFWEYIVGTKYLNGDGFAPMVRNRAGIVTEVLPISPLETEVERDRNTLRYLVNSEYLGRFGVHQDDMLHFHGFGFNGRRSISVIKHAARMAVGTQLAQDEFAARFFAQGAQPSVVIRYPGGAPAEMIEQLRQRWQERQAGLDNAHKPLVLTNNGDVKELTMSPEDAQLLESRRFGVEEIARAFGVPPFMIGSTEKTTSWGSGVEQMGQGFVRFTLRRILKRFEQELNRKLFRTSKYFCEFNVDALQQGDLKAQGEYFQKALGGAQGPAWMTPNEVRRLINEPPLDGGDELYKPAPKGDSNAPAEPNPPASS